MIYIFHTDFCESSFYFLLNFRLHEIKRHKRQVSDLLTTNNGKLMVSVSWDNTARLWNISDGKEAGMFKELQTYPFNCIAIEPEEKFVALGGWKKFIYIWDILVNKKQAVRNIFDLAVKIGFMFIMALEALVFQ